MSDNYLDVQAVCSKLAAAGVDDAVIGKVYAARLQPEKLDDPEKKFVMGVPGPSDQVLLVVYKFGLGQPMVKRHPLDEGGPDWRPRFLSVEGPFALEDAGAKAKELTSA